MRVSTLAGLPALTVFGLTVLGLAACNRQAQTPSGAPAASGGPAASSAAASAAPPAEPAKPRRKPGLWEQHLSLGGTDMVQTSQICIDDATEQKLSMFGAQVNRQMCKTYQLMRKLDGSWAFSSVCSMGSGGTVTTAGTVTGDFATAYKVRSETTTTGAVVPQMNGDRKVDIDAAWMGPCKPGQKGGDMILPNGMKVNLLNLKQPSVGAGEDKEN
jgi:hypothetical protein